MSFEMSGFKGAKPHFPTVNMIWNQNAVSHAGATVPLLHYDTVRGDFLEQRGEDVNKAGSTNGLAGS